MTTPNQKRNLHHQRWTFNSTEDIAEHAGDLAQKILLDLTPLDHGAITFALLRKAVIVIPLTYILPRLGLGVWGVFLAEPISNVLGGCASFTTMLITVYFRLGKRPIATSAKL